MSIEQLVCVSIGVFVQAATFALGIMVGVSLKRKEATHGNGNDYWHSFEHRGTEKGTGGR